MGDAATLTLYVDAYWASPFDFSCWVALREKGLEFATSRAIIRYGMGFSQRYRDLMVVARVPALAHGDFWLSESMAVIEYLEDAFPAPGYPSLWPADVRSRARARQIMSFVRTELGALRRDRSSWRVVYPGAGSPPQPLAPDARVEADELLQVAGRLVAEGDVRGWPLAAAELTFALLRLVRSGDPVPAALVAFTEEICARPSVKEYLEHTRPPNPPDDGR